jgi:hypothetical protein
MALSTQTQQAIDMALGDRTALTELLLNLNFVSSTLASAINTTNNVANTTVTGFAFPVGASEVWVADFYLACTGNTGGIKLQLTGPAGPTAVSMQTIANNTATNTFISDIETAFSSQTAGVCNYAGNGLVQIHALVNNGLNTGNVQLAFNSGTNANNTAILAGSYMTAHRIA